MKTVRGLIFVKFFPYEVVWPKRQCVERSVSTTAKMKQFDLLQKNSKTKISILTTWRLICGDSWGTGQLGLLFVTARVN